MSVIRKAWGTYSAGFLRCRSYEAAYRGRLAVANSQRCLWPFPGRPPGAGSLRAILRRLGVHQRCGESQGGAGVGARQGIPGLGTRSRCVPLTRLAPDWQSPELATPRTLSYGHGFLWTWVPEAHFLSRARALSLTRTHKKSLREHTHHALLDNTPPERSENAASLHAAGIVAVQGIDSSS